MITTKEMSQIGLGTRKLDTSNAVSEKKSSGYKTLQNIFREGINTIDTSPVAEQGQSELVIGNFLDGENCRDGIFLSSKCGYEWDLNDKLTRDLTLERLQQELEESMNRMKVDAIDLYLLNTHGDEESYKSSFNSLNHIYDHRNVRHIGLKDPSLDQLKNAVDIADLDFIQLRHSIFNSSAYARLHSICEQNDIRMIAHDMFDDSGKAEFEASGDGTGSDELPTDSAHYKEELRFVVQTYFDGEYPNETIENLMANWAVNTPRIHSGIVEVNCGMAIDSIVRILQFSLSEDDYQSIDQIMSSFDR